MDKLFEELGIDYTIECSAADSAAFEDRTSRGQSRVGTAIRYLWNEQQARVKPQLPFRPTELVSVRLNGFRFGKIVASRVFDRIVSQLYSSPPSNVGNGQKHFGIKPAGSNATGTAESTTTNL